MSSQAQIRRPGPTASSRTGDRGPVQAQIPEVPMVGMHHADAGGPEGRSRMYEVEAA